MTEWVWKFDSMKKSATTHDFSPDQPAVCTVQGCGNPFDKSRYEPCDVDFLTITNHSNATASSVTCTVPASADPSMTWEIKQLLGSDDLLLQTVADYHHDGSYDPAKLKEAEIGIDGTTSPQCSTLEHRKIEWTAVSNPPPDAWNREWEGNVSVEPQKLLAKSTRATPQGGFLERFWPFGGSDTVIYRAEISSCGVRDGAKPTTRLRGRVEVQPDVKYEISLKIPSFYKMKREREGNYQFSNKEYNTSSTKSTSYNFGRDATSQTSSSHWNEGEGFSFNTETTSTRVDGGDTHYKSSSKGRKNWTEYTAKQESLTEHGWVLDTKVTHKDSTEKEPTLEDELKAGTNISLRRNDEEIDIVKSIENIIKISKEIQKAWDNFEKAVPKIGWHASLEIEIFTGTFSGEWGVRPKAAPTHPRVWETERYFNFNVDIKVFYVKAEVGFGYEFIVKGWLSKHPALDIRAKVTGSVSVDVPFKTAIEWNKRDTLESTLGVKPISALTAIAHASAIGYIFEASCNIEAGIEFTGTFKVDFDYSPTCEGKLEWVPITVTVNLQYPMLSSPPPHVWTWPEKKLDPIWSGTIFGDPEPNGSLSGSSGRSGSW